MGRVGRVAVTLPRLLGSPHPVLDSVLPVVEGSRDVETDPERLAGVASWLAYEELPLPSSFLPVPLDLSREEIVDFVLVATALNFAFTSFETHERWDLVLDGRVFADADGLHVALHRALGEGIPILDGSWLSQVTAGDLRHVFRGGTSELQLLDERAAILRQLGDVLLATYGGRFAKVLESSSPALYDDGNGFLEVLVRDFRRFDDVAEWEGRAVRFWKLAQLAVWILELTLPGGLGFRDLDRLTAFADYIVPAGMRAMGILRYSSALDDAIARRELIGAGSREEVELRAHTIYATALLTDRVNELRPSDRQVIVPQIDARFWVPFHKTHAPHHLTRTIYY
jgi:Potential Queuosine, Q, salvage protein family